MPFGTVAFDADGSVTYLNPAAAWLLQLPAGQLAAAADLPVPQGENPVLDTLRTAQPSSAVHTKSSGRSLTLQCWPVPGGGAVMALWDSSAEQAEMDHLRYLVYNDTLTGLPNRNSFFGELALQLSPATQRQGRMAVLLADLDDFREINDLHGHGRADAILRQFAGRLSALVGEDGTVARLGGDEFGIILHDIGSAWHARRTAEQILQAARQPFDADDRQLEVRISIGIAVHDSQDTSPEQLYNRAAVALQRAKESGGGGHEYYDEHLDARFRGDLELANDLELALDRGELHLVYQPMVDVRTGSIVAAETLIRWQHPTRGAISPVEFIPLAEQSGAIIRIGEWVLEQAVRNLVHWLPLAPDFHLSINVSPGQLASKQFLTDFARILGINGVPHRAVMLELTETYLMADVEKAGRDLRRYATMGVSIAIDDFGTGYSSLRYLQLLPITHVKIDRSFIDRMLSDGRSRELVEAILLMAGRLGVTVVAEGVENEEQRALLADLSCDYAQGYHFGRPVPADEFGKLLAGD